MVHLTILKLVMVQLPMKKLIKIEINHGQFNHVQLPIVHLVVYV